MAGMKKYMVVHRDPNVSWDKIQENWAKLANVTSANWVRTSFNKDEGIRYCVWLSPNPDKLKMIFNELNVSWESITEVEETTPDLWGKRWEAHLSADATADNLGF
jgi:hypothetical protein